MNSLARGLAGWPDHRVLELLLYYAIPQGDVNGLAHELVERFGSLAGVLDATAEELCRVPGVGQHTGCPAQADPGGRGALPPEPGGPGGAGAPDGRRLRTAGALLLRGPERDGLPAVRWMGRTSALGVRKVAEGSICAAEHQSAPDHGGGRRPPGAPRSIWPTTTSATWPSPPRWTCSTTQTMRTALAGVGIELLDHLVFVDGDMVSMRDSGMMK